MKGVMFIIFALSILFFLGMAHFFFASKRPGVYPPKYILRRRAGAFAMGGILFLLIGILFAFFK
ncbi:hypothetical protein [Neobacillus sp. D3-1R]|uniref:hypothetical protein n=1 Tax=Neobacillus sp. D3-1R TaxID=3445778 RepID=UPI003F9F14B9